MLADREISKSVAFVVSAPLEKIRSRAASWDYLNEAFPVFVVDELLLQ
jgi:hypothetical protein